jgi:hypothetical protein
MLQCSTTPRMRHYLGLESGSCCKYVKQPVARATHLNHEQIVTNDMHNLALVIEGLAWIVELICRYAVTEALYMQSASKADQGLEKAVVKLYASILGYLSKAKQYFEQGTASQCTPSRGQIQQVNNTYQSESPEACSFLRHKELFDFKPALL